MTNRDTHDIEEYERELRATNVQPALLIKLMQESEPCLFANKSEPAVVSVVKNIEYEISPHIKQIAARMMDIARWHAQLQVSYERALLREVNADAV